PVSVERFLSHLLAAGKVGHIDSRRQGLAAAVLDSSGNAALSFVIDIGDDSCSTFTRDSQAISFADAMSTAGDNHHFPVQQTHESSLLNKSNPKFLNSGSRVIRFEPLQINYHRAFIIVKSRTLTFLDLRFKNLAQFRLEIRRQTQKIRDELLRLLR